MKALVDVTFIKTQRGVVHLQLELGGVKYTAEGDNLDQDKPQPTPERVTWTDVCARERVAFKELSEQNKGVIEAEL